MRKILCQSIAIIGVALAFMITGCEGPAGPMGPAGVDGTDGADGADGTNGTDGTEGVDGNAVCLTCHNLATKAAITLEYDSSGHAAAGAVGYAGARNGCAKCHSEQGFIETQYTGRDTTAANIPIPHRISCNTCHDFHETLDFEGDGSDYALRTTMPVDLHMFRNYYYAPPNDSLVTVDLGDESNLCANCHQPRRDWHYRLTFSQEEDSASVGTTHWGPHPSGQLGVYEGIVGYELDGSLDYPTGPAAHREDASCIICHMDESNHEFEPVLDACNTADCHNGAMTSLVQSEIVTLLGNLEEDLITAGLLDNDGGIVTGTMFPINEVQAMWNYWTVEEDGSHGVHNYDYVKALLQNSIEQF